MRVWMRFATMALLAIAPAAPAFPQPLMIEDFAVQPETRWRFFADTVMGGESSGKVQFVQQDGRTFARMTGRVSTANNGGFIQIRMDLAAPPPDTVTGVRLIVRGNDQRYFVHLRTNGTVLPWQYYQAGFDATGTWTEVRLPLSAFAASGAMLRGAPRAGGLTSVGIVAYGRDHDADIAVAEIGFY